jgi:hypothetical protein
MKPYNTDELASRLTNPDLPSPPPLFDHAILKDGYLMCPWPDCSCGHRTHIVDVVWERDPREGDRRWVRMEVRCELSRGYLLLIRNHHAKSYFDVVLLDDTVVSPFGEGAHWR